MTRLIDADELIEKLHGRAFKDGDDRSIVCEIIKKMPTEPEPYSSDEVSNMLNEIDYWRKHCDLLERTVIKLAIRYMEREGV